MSEDWEKYKYTRDVLELAGWQFCSTDGVIAPSRTCDLDCGTARTLRGLERCKVIVFNLGSSRFGILMMAGYRCDSTR